MTVEQLLEQIRNVDVFQAVRRWERIEAAGRLLVAGWEDARGLTFSRQMHELGRLVDQLRSALEPCARAEPSPGGDPPATA